MGCCTPNNNNMIDFRLEKIEEFNRLKFEISEIISNKEHKDRKNINKLFELFNRTSIKINEYEREIRNLKVKKDNKQSIDNGMLQGLNNDIKQLKEFNHILNELIKKSDEENENEIINSDNKADVERIYENQIKTESENNSENEKEIIKKKINVSKKDIIGSNKMDNDRSHRNYNNKKFSLKKLLENDFKNGIKSKFHYESETDFVLKDNDDKIDTPKELINLTANNINSITSSIERDEKIYYKKSVRRNKKSDILNRKSYPFSEPDNEDNNNIINLILALENGQNVGVQAEKTQKFLVILEKLGENEEDYNDIENLELFDENGEITDKVLNGDLISSFGYNDNQVIQIKLKN